MRKWILAPVFLFGLSSPPTPLVAHSVMLEWDRVAVCETGGNWRMEGPVYSGALGILNANWVRYGGRRFASDAGRATPEEQVWVAERINRGYPVPDQNGCAKW